tara:strand:+ start:2938 stop:3186 length:249 start_codon:yes stop_codon:yes gene_type:complete
MELLEKFGIPITVSVAFGYFIWKQNKYIQEDLAKDIHQKFNRLEAIIVKLIDQQKKIQLEVRTYKASYEALVKIITNMLKKR